MNILMISHYAGAPKYGMEYRSYYMGREWVRMGHNVMIVGAAFSHLRKQQPEASEETIDGIRYLWLPTTRYESNGLKRVLSMFQFVGRVYSHRKSLIAFQPDIVVASSVYTLDIYPCHYIARHTGARLVYEVHDLWPLSVIAIGGYSKWHPFVMLLQHCENYAYRHCDMVVSMLDKAFPHMQRHGLSEDRFCCIPNGFVSDEWDTPPAELPRKHQQLLKQLHERNRIIVGFAGGHTRSTAMQVFVEAARNFQDDPSIAFVLVGDGPQKPELVSMAEKYELANIHFLPPIRKQCIPSLLHCFDICYAGGVHCLLHHYGTSFNKITDYMLSAKPIVNSVDEPDSEVERQGCGIQVEAENVEQVCRAIRTLANMSTQERTEMGQKGRAYALENLNYRTLAERFLNNVCGNSACTAK